MNDALYGVWFFLDISKPIKAPKNNLLFKRALQIRNFGNCDLATR